LVHTMSAQLPQPAVPQLPLEISQAAP
jgi:hypothetical protein